MSRIACVLLLTVCVAPARGADLPPGAVARLGDYRFRAGGSISHLALSPDGKQYATAHAAGTGRTAVTVWDAGTGRPVHEQLVTDKLFRGLVWGKNGAFAVARRAAPGTKGAPAAQVPDDFCVWDFTDPKGAPPLVALPRIVERTSGSIDGSGQAPAAYTGFRFGADGARLAVRWEGADEKHAVHVFELKPVPSAAKLARVGTIDLGTEGTDDFALSADGSAVVTARRLSDPEQRGTRESAVTVWSVARGKPEKPVRVPGGERLMLAPDARSLVAFVAGDRDWGFDVVPIVLPHKSSPRDRQRVRWPVPRDGSDVYDEGGFAFFPPGEKLAVAADRGTLVIDTAAGKELGRLEGHADAPTAVAVSDDGARIATADAFGLVRFWDAKTFRPLTEAPGHRAPVEHADLSPDGKRLLTWAFDETVRLWDIGTGTELRAFAGAVRAGDEGTRPAFTADGTAIVYHAKDRLVARDLQTGLEVPLPGERKSNPAALGAGANPFASARASDGGAVVLREAASGAVRRTLEGHRGEVRVLGFTPDGTKLLTAGGDHTVLVWDVRLQAVTLPDALKNETNAAKLWDQLATGKADAAYLAMARLSHDPFAAVKIAKLRLKPAAKGDPETEDGKVADARAVELLEALATDESNALLKQLAGGYAAAFRTQEAKRAVARGENK